MRTHAPILLPSVFVLAALAVPTAQAKPNVPSDAKMMRASAETKEKTDADAMRKNADDAEAEMKKQDREAAEAAAKLLPGISVQEAIDNSWKPENNQDSARWLDNAKRRAELGWLPSRPRFTSTAPLLKDVDKGFGLSQTYFTPELRIIQPKLRVFFDTGSDDDGEIDIFENGELTPNLNLVELRLTHYFHNERWLGVTELGGHPRYQDFQSRWSWGPNIGLGISAPAQDGEEDDGVGGTTLAQASDAPVVLFTVGAFLEYDLTHLTDDQRAKVGEAVRATGNSFSGPKIGVEGGWAYGVSADEGLSDTDDSAWYIGLSLHFPF